MLEGAHQTHQEGQEEAASVALAETSIKNGGAGILEPQAVIVIEARVGTAIHQDAAHRTTSHVF